MRKRLLVSVGFVIGMICLNFFGPYNVLTALTSNNLVEYDEIQKQLEGKILDIKYIGNKTYEIKTDKKEYILVENGDYVYLKYKIFEMKREIEVFKNPM